jgi:hypothetical protein
MPSVSRTHRDWLIVVSVNLTVPTMVVWEHHACEASRTVALVSGFASLFVLNAVIIAAIHFRDQRNGNVLQRGFVIGAFGLALVSALLTAIGVYLTPERNDYLELALSNIPLDQIHPEQKALVVGLVRRSAANSRDYKNAAAQMQPISPQLYSAESFANDSVIRSVSEQYKKATAIDFAYREEQVRTMNDFKSKMMNVDPDYLKSFEAGRQEQQTREFNLFQLEQECATATVGLYDYAEKHAKDIALKDGQLTLTNDAVRAEFSRQLEMSKSLNERLQTAHQELVRRQQRSRDDVGLKPSSYVSK